MLFIYIALLSQSFIRISCTVCTTYTSQVTLRSPIKRLYMSLLISCLYITLIISIFRVLHSLSFLYNGLFVYQLYLSIFILIYSERLVAYDYLNKVKTLYLPIWTHIGFELNDVYICLILLLSCDSTIYPIKFLYNYQNLFKFTISNIKY